MIDIDLREKRAMELFREGYNCCQSVALAFADVIGDRTGMTEEQIAAVTSGFGGGFARMREVCGSVSGMTFVAGALIPASADPAAHGTASAAAHESVSAKETRRANYALVQKMASRFREENGSMICRELLGIRISGKESPMPSDRTPEYYAARPCERLVGSAARILATEISGCEN